MPHVLRSLSNPHSTSESVYALHISLFIFLRVVGFRITLLYRRVFAFALGIAERRGIEDDTGAHCVITHRSVPCMTIKLLVELLTLILLA